MEKKLSETIPEIYKENGKTSKKQLIMKNIIDFKMFEKIEKPIKVDDDYKNI
jgi:hypothetical protein